MAINENAVTDTLTPTTGTLTVAGTESVQNVTLVGTGQNFVIYSQTIGNSSWVNSGTATSATNTGATTDPLGGNTATLITSATDVTLGGNNVREGVTGLFSSATYTASVYFKLGTATTCSIAIRDAGTGITTTSTTTTSGAWVRVSATAALGTGSTRFDLMIGNANGTFYAWGAQLEIGSVANTYVPTTTTAVYGTPAISFNGASSIGLQSDGSLFVQPAGTGALQAQQTTSSTTGGNARGANAVDWQTSRNSASQVASALGSVIVGGRTNTANNQDAFVGGGYGNVAGNGPQSTVVGGANNTANEKGSIVGGSNNSALGLYSFIGGCFTNTANTNAAVTTQATTTVTSGSTAVTLSASNASIKVGQVITGTGIVSYTYVSAISGTSLTLSQNANASGSPTLSFYTPHGIVVGGGNNQATGSYSFVGGGGDAGTAGNANKAQSDWSTVAGGFKNVIPASTANYAFIGGGQSNTSNGINNAIVGGTLNQAFAYNSFIGGGSSNIANANYSSVIGGLLGTTRGIQGITVLNSGQNPMYPTQGGAQLSILTIGRITTDATATLLTSDGNAATSTNQVILPNNSAYYVRGSIIAGVTGAGNTASWTFQGAIKRGSGVGTTAIVGTGITAVSVAADTGAATWAVSITADTTNGGLAVTVTGQAATTIRWVCQIETTEMTY